MDAWVREGRQVTDAVPPARTGTLPSLDVHPVIVTAPFVRAHLGTAGFAVVDARTAPFYQGTQTGGSKERPHRTGHIAGALSIPFTEVFDDRLMLRSAADLAALFTRARVKRGDTVIAYCHIGQQATAVIFAARTLGHPVRLYDGSFEEWSRLPGMPVDNPAKR